MKIKDYNKAMSLMNDVDSDAGLSDISLSIITEEMVIAANRNRHIERISDIPKKLRTTAVCKELFLHPGFLGFAANFVPDEAWDAELVQIATQYSNRALMYVPQALVTEDLLLKLADGAYDEGLYIILQHGARIGGKDLAKTLLKRALSATMEYHDREEYAIDSQWSVNVPAFVLRILLDMPETLTAERSRVV